MNKYKFTQIYLIMGRQTHINMKINESHKQTLDNNHSTNNINTYTSIWGTCLSQQSFSQQDCGPSFKILILNIIVQSCSDFEETGFSLTLHIALDECQKLVSRFSHFDYFNLLYFYFYFHFLTWKWLELCMVRLIEPNELLHFMTNFHPKLFYSLIIDDLQVLFFLFHPSFFKDESPSFTVLLWSHIICVLESHVFSTLSINRFLLHSHCKSTIN